MIKAEPESTSLSGVEWQRAKDAPGLPVDVTLPALTREGAISLARPRVPAGTRFR